MRGALPGRGGLVLTAQDLREPAEEERRGNHERSQELLQQILRHRGIQARTGNLAPFVHDEAGDVEQKRLGLTGRICARLRERGIHGIRTFRVMLHNMDTQRNGTCLGRTLEGALAHMGIRLQAAEFDRLIDLFRADEEDTVDYVQLLAYSCSNWSMQRQEVVKEAYDYLSEVCPGSILHIAAIEGKFHAQALTPDLVPELVEHHSAKEFLTQWGSSALGADGVVTWLDFADYYLDVSICFGSDRDFCHYVCRSWGIDTDDWLAKKVFRRFASQDNEGTLPAKDFLRMLNELDPAISEEEALAWYEAIDEDDSGEVSLEEFLSSKVLKVKRLFDEFDTQESRTASKEEMLQILRSLSSTVTDEEALALYHYADLDGNGGVSFTEFLENNLLKLLQILEQFARHRNRSLNEAEMKLLLRRQDPYLDDAELQQIYKAIDTDGSGNISFVEFCESHVLRAKMLFDRYDTDRSRTLTQFKFRELLMDMDDSLTASQVEAIYDLVTDHNSGKVHLGGFLNPNVVRLKLCFTKYDKDGSRCLDVSEFRAMLKEMFTSASEKEVDALLGTVMPPDSEEGITFTDYLQRFKEISHKYDLLQLAKRREARTKASTKGLACDRP